MGTTNQPQQPEHAGHGTGGGHEPTQPVPGPLQWYGAPSPAAQPQDPRRGAFGAPNAGAHQPPRYDGGPQGPYGSHAQPGPQGAPQGGPAHPSGPFAPTATKKPRRRYELPAVALLAAVLASGGTYGVGQLTDGGANTAAGTTSSSAAAPVVQATGSSPDWTATAKAVAPSVVAIKVTNGQTGGQGSGVIIDTEGHVVTNNHVATAGGQGARITITLSDKSTYSASVVGTDPSTDLAVLQIDDPPSDLTPISMGNSSKLAVGEPVMAVGNPLGLAGTVTTGIVSALDRPVTTQGESSGLGQASQPVTTNAIQTSAAINPGNSGGALVNDSGQLIGINSSIATLGSSQLQGAQSGNIGIGFAIPVNEVRSIADQLITNGKAQHAYLGVQTQDTTVQVGSAKRAAAGIKVLAGTPAAKAGLKTGDAIIAIDGDSIDGASSLVAQVHERTPGDKATLTIVRGGERQDVQVTFGVKE